jgi:hypothetical protein
MRPTEALDHVRQKTQQDFDAFSKSVCKQVWRTNLSGMFDKVIDAVSPVLEISLNTS